MRPKAQSELETAPYLSLCSHKVKMFMAYKQECQSSSYIKLQNASVSGRAHIHIHTL